MHAGSRLQSAWAHLQDALASLAALLSEWVGFLAVLFRPQVFILGTLAVVTWWAAQGQAGPARTILEALMALAASLAGGFLFDAYQRATGNVFLIKKSAAAIRNLQAIKDKVLNSGLRIDAVRDPEHEREWDEVANLVDLIGRDVLNAIGDWHDVNPASDAVVGTLDTIANNERAADVLRRELRQAQKARAEAEDANALTKEQLDEKDQTIQTLKDEIQELDAETAKLRATSNTFLLSSPFTASGSAGLSPAITSAGIAFAPTKGATMSLCSKCFTPIDTATGQCPKCGPPTPTG